MSQPDRPSAGPSRYPPPLGASFDQLAVGLIQVAPDGGIIAANRALCDLLGYTAAELTPLTLTDITHPDDRARAFPPPPPVENRAGDDREVRLVRRDGSEIWTRVTGSLIQDAASGASYWLAVVEDIGAQRRTDEQARRAEDATKHRLTELQAELAHLARMNAVGQLAGALAHELNQPLTAASSYMGACRRVLEAGNAPVDTLRELIDKAAAQIARTGQIVGRLRTFIEKGEIERAAHDVNAVVEETGALGMIGAKLAAAQLTLALSRPLPPVFIDRIQVQQVLVNLARNAVEAMTGDRRLLVLGTRRYDDAFVEVWVSDTGPGLPASVAERLFQPFVSTKQTGLGIGLSICRSIIDAHGGALRAEPNPGGGTVFRFTLPVAPSVATRPS